MTRRGDFCGLKYSAGGGIRYGRQGWKGLQFSVVRNVSNRSTCSTRSESHSASAGFTLVEILITVLLLGFLGSWSLLSARNMLPRMRVEQASSRLAFQLQLARSEAIAQNQIVYVNLDSDENTLQVWADTNRDEEQDDDEWFEVLLEDPALVTLQSTWSTGAFNAYGQFITTPGQREMKTVTTTIRPAGAGDKVIELTLRGSGAITKR